MPQSGVCGTPWAQGSHPEGLWRSEIMHVWQNHNLRSFPVSSFTLACLIPIQLGRHGSLFVLRLESSELDQ